MTNPTDELEVACDDGFKSNTVGDVSWTDMNPNSITLKVEMSSIAGFSQSLSAPLSFWSLTSGGSNRHLSFSCRIRFEGVLEGIGRVIAGHEYPCFQGWRNPHGDDAGQAKDTYQVRRT